MLEIEEYVRWPAVCVRSESRLRPGRLRHARKPTASKNFRPHHIRLHWLEWADGRPSWWSLHPPPTQLLIIFTNNYISKAVLTTEGC